MLKNIIIPWAIKIGRSIFHPNAQPFINDPKAKLTSISQMKVMKDI